MSLLLFLPRSLSKGVSTSSMPKLLNVEMELRKCCNHPWLVTGAEEKEVRVIDACGRCNFIDRVLYSWARIPLTTSGLKPQFQRVAR